MTRSLAAALIALAGTGAAATLAIAAPATSNDSPVIVPWHRIGSAELSGSRAGVRRAYADSRVHLGAHDDDTFDAPDSDGLGYLSVAYDGDEVVDIATTSDRYRTPGGVGVGSLLRPRHGPSGLTYRRTDPKPGYGRWTGTLCYRGIRTFVRLTVQENHVDGVSMYYGAGKLCGRQTPRFPLSAQDRRDIASTLPRQVNGKPTTVGRFRVSIDSKRWASVWLSGKDRSVQSAFVVLEHRAGAWRVVDLGTSDVGCGHVPIKPLTEIGGACGPNANAP